MVIKADPVPNHTAGVLQGLESVAVNTLVFEGSDHPLDHPVLLRAIRRNELLFHPIASDQGYEASAGKN